MSCRFWIPPWPTNEQSLSNLNIDFVCCKVFAFKRTVCAFVGYGNLP